MTMAKKSKAQIKRLIQRASDRGEVYVPPEETPETAETESEKNESKTVGEQNSTKNKNEDSLDSKKYRAADQLKKDLKEIENDESLKAKDRRSRKRKAEAIALESSGCTSVEDLTKWFEEYSKANPRKSTDDTERKRNPYIVFIGQLPYDVTKEQLFQHIQKQLKDDHKVTHQNIKIRLLTDAKSKKSRGMAFCEVSDDPELLYSCLKLHHTHLGGRRINVERSAGGSKNSDARKKKIQSFRDEQVKHMDEAVNAMLEEYYKRGEIQRSGEIDDGVILLCKRHSATVVQAALERFVESNGREMDNPSAYLTFLLGKLAEEGIYNDREKEQKGGKRESSGRHSTTQNDQNKRMKRGKEKFADSEFAKQGVDLNASQSTGNLSSIFPSLNRGRGRGRGYM